MLNPKFRRYERLSSATLCLALLATTGCSGGNGNANSSGNKLAISEQPLSGKIGGQAWSLGTAESDSYLSTTEQYFVNMYSETFTACTSSAGANSNRFIAQLPTKVGSFDLGLNLTATFCLQSTNDNLVSTSGRIQIDSITASVISGGLNVTFDADNSIDGQFQASICP